jgi:hypothetical protein
MARCRFQGRRRDCAAQPSSTGSDLYLLVDGTRYGSDPNAPAHNMPIHRENGSARPSRK